MTAPTCSNRSARHHELRAARAQDRGHAARRARRRAARSAPCVASPTPRPSTTTFFHAGSSVKPDAERPDHVELVARLERREPAVPRPTHLVEKLDAAVGAVDAVDALRPAQPQLAHVGRRAKQIEELPRLDRRAPSARPSTTSVLVFGVHPVVRHDRAQRLFRRNMRLRGRGSRSGLRAKGADANGSASGTFDQPGSMIWGVF